MSAVDDVISSVETVIDSAKVPAKTVPPILLSPELKQRCGLSATRLYINIVSRFAEIGIPSEDNDDGTPNIQKLLVKVICEELIKEIKENALVETVADMGSITSTGTAGPIPVTCINNTFNEFRGTIL